MLFQIICDKVPNYLLKISDDALCIRCYEYYDISIGT